MIADQQTAPDITQAPPSLPAINHRVRKDRILRSIVEGVAVRAACGERFVVDAQSGGSTEAVNAALCPLCELLYGQMKEE